MDFPCPSCGGQLHWKPGAGALVCPHCDTKVDPPASDPSPIVEHRLEDAARVAPKGWGTETVTIACDGCGASVDVGPHEKSSACPFCGSSKVHPDPSGDLLRPESVLPFAIDKADAAKKFRAWISGLWFRPSALKSAAQLEQIAGVYIPAWTFDAQVRSTWQAESGTHYTVEEEVTVVEDGKRVRRMQRVQKTRWTPASGSRAGAYDDWIVQASKGLDQSALKGLSPFRLEQLKPYAETYLAGLRAERYAVGLDEAWVIAQRELDSEETAKCRALVPGDTQRGLQVQSRYSDVRFKHMLLPVWIAAYRYEGKAYRYLVNGQTGTATGDAPYSMWKIAAFVLAIGLLILFCAGVFGGTATVGAVVTH